jgi:hypothetical protein
MAIRKPLFLGGFGPETLAVAADGIDLGNAAEISGNLTFDTGGEPRGLPALPTAADAAASKAYVDSVTAGGRVWKELLLHRDQLLNGGSGGILQSILIALSANPTASNTFVITDGTTTETYTFVATETAAFEVAIGGSAAATLTNLIQAINDDSALWSAVGTTGLDAYFAAAYATQGVVYRTAASTANDRVYGTISPTTAIKVNEFVTAGYNDYTNEAATESNLPSADPAAKRFGFGRLFASLTTNETHLLAENNAIYTWDSDDNLWQQVDSAAIVAGAGLLRSGDTISVELNTAAAATGAGTGGGSSGLEFDVVGDGGKLRAAVSATGALERASDGLKVRTDGSTISIVGNQLTVIGSTDAEKVSNLFTSAAGGLTAGDPVFFSGNDIVDDADADSVGGTGRKVMGIAMTTVGGAASVEVATIGKKVAGVLTSLSPTAGDPVWLANGGGLTLAAPVGANDRVLVGYAENADDLFVIIQQLGRAA